LDEIGDLSANAQAKLLRVLEYKEFQRVGGEDTLRVDVRLISATNQVLKDLIAKGRFREDLFFRINEITVQIPPLRDRPEDILLLADQFVREFHQTMGKRVNKLSDAAKRILLSYGWPGNIRELRSLIKRAVTLADDRREALWIEDLGTQVIFIGEAKDEKKDLSLSAAEHRHVEKVLKLSAYNKSKAAEILGISRPTLDKKINDYKIKFPKDL
jgi:transcriptional regulator with PAS, ATPase and Fis domain